MRDARRALDPPSRVSAANAVAHRLLDFPGAPACGRVAGYWAMDGEIALHAWQLGLPAGVTYCLPVLHEDGRLRFAAWRPGEPLAANRHGIPEPDVPRELLLEAHTLDAAIVPLVAFDAHCHRLGMGGGWYDRTYAFRADSPAPPLLLGAAFELQRVDALQAEAWDIPLDGVCTERATHLPEPTRP